jgi:transposase, IS30 family
MKHYTHFSEKERENLYFYLLEWKKQCEIAVLISKDPSSISRELKRNSILKEHKFNKNNKEKKKWENYHYLPNKAHKKYLERKSESWKMGAILKWYSIRCKVVYYIKKWYSPPLISWIIKNEWLWNISHEAIYQFIYHDDYKHLKLREHLPMRRKRRKKHNWRSIKKTKIPNRIDISQRPEEINNRTLFWNWESDSIEGLRWCGASLHVSVERKTRKTKIRKLKRKTAENTNIVFKDIFWNMPRKAILTITPDNWTEFSSWEKVRDELWIAFYFTHPYSSREKWTVERINWFIRRFFPKWTNFNTISDEEIQSVEDWINNRPMEVLGFKTPNEAYNEEILLIN